MVEEMIQIKMDEYVRIYGQKEAVAIMEKLNDSKIFTQNIHVAIRKGEVPSVKIINDTIHSSSTYFLLAGKRKIYFASLYFLFCLYKRTLEFDFYADDVSFSGRLLEICERYIR